jgi:hypothetical protein
MSDKATIAALATPSRNAQAIASLRLVGSDVETGCGVEGLCSRPGQEEDPNAVAVAPPEAPTDLVAVQHRHVDVEDDNVDVVLVYDPQRLAAVCCLEGSEARVLQERRLKGA